MPWGKNGQCCKSKTSKKIDNLGLVFDKSISIQRNSQRATLSAISNTEWVAVTLFTAFADIKTRATPQMINGINSSTSITHIFSIEYSSGIYQALAELTQDFWVLYSGKRYYVSTLENIDEADKVIRLVASLRGKDTVEFSKSK